MNYLTRELVQSRVEEHYEELSKQGELFAVFLKGSQNYSDKFHESSDVDTVAVFMPNFEQIVLGEECTPAAPHSFENGELATRQDFRKFIKLFKKASSTHLECLYTDYFVVNPKYVSQLEELKRMREDLARIHEGNMIMSIKGLATRDAKQIFKETKADFEKFGYSRKHLSHVVRMHKMALAYKEGKSFEECLKSTPEEYLYEVKYGKGMQLDTVNSLLETIYVSLGELSKGYKEYKADNEVEVQGSVNKFLVETLKVKLKQEN